jgi:hypothetical protein
MLRESSLDVQPPNSAASTATANRQVKAVSVTGDPTGGRALVHLDPGRLDEWPPLLDLCLVIGRDREIAC